MKEIKYYTKNVPSSTVVSVGSLLDRPFKLRVILEFPYPFRTMLELLRDKSDLDNALAVPVLITYASAHLSKSDNIVLKRKNEKKM